MPPDDPLASDNPIATRRYAYAIAAIKDGDLRAAADVLEQTLEIAPRWAAAWFSLGETREKLGEIEEARDAFARARASDASDPFGAGARLALLDGAPAAALPAAYVTRLFDDYGPRFEAHLIGALGYRAPELIVAALDRVAPGRRFARALDIGCGTGLAGRALRGRVDALSGVDLSARMVAKARETGDYDALEVGEAVAFLEASPPGRADLIVAADVFVYLGDLAPVFAASARALAAGGLIAFSLEATDGGGFRLGPAMRFAHSRAHVEAAAARAGLRSRELAPASTRREDGRDAPGWIGLYASA